MIGKVTREMAKPPAAPVPPDPVISFIGPGLRITGDCESSDTIRIEGTVEGGVKARKAVVVGKQGSVTGDIETADAKIAGTVQGKLEIGSRLELASSAVIDGEIRAARMLLEEGGAINGAVKIGGEEAAKADSAVPAPPTKTSRLTKGRAGRS